MKAVIAIATMLFIAACANSSADGTKKEYASLSAPTPAGVAMRITAADESQNVSTKVGTTIAIELIGVPTAGYVWTPSMTPAFLESAGEYGGPTSSAQLEPGFAGGNHWEAFLFKVTKAGEGELRFEQRRPWEDDSEAPVDEFSVYLFAEE